MRLEQAMAGRQRHLVDVRRVPRRDKLAARGGIAADERDEIGDLIYMAAVGRLPIAPLLAVDRAQLARLVGPLVPDAHALLLQPADVGAPAQEPQKLDD